MFESISSAIQILDAAFSIRGSIKAALASLRRRSLEESSIAKVVEDHFSGRLSATAEVRVRGVLVPYVLSTSQLAYRAVVAGPAEEVAHKDELDLSTRQWQRTTTVRLSHDALSVPAIQLAAVDLHAGGRARVWWLYPSGCEGLTLPQKPSFTASAGSPLDVFDLRDTHRPIPCLLPTDVSVNELLANDVEVVGQILSPSPETIAPLSDRLDDFGRNVLSNALRPFGNTSSMLAVDLRQSDSVKVCRGRDAFPVVVSVQGTIAIRDLTDEEAERFFIAIVDAVPDRAGMGPLRSITWHGGNEVFGVISTGRLRWVFDRRNSAMGVYAEVNIKDAATATATATEIASHWHAWQKKARNDVRQALGVEPKINPILVWDPEKLRRFHPDGLALPRDIEARLASSDPAVREGIDWLRVAGGR